MLYLKQSTAVTVKIGPFLDSTNGDDAETGLTIARADVLLSKNGGAFTQKTEATSCTHDSGGMYGCPLDGTDTGTLGRLQLFVHESGALAVWHEYMVVTANVYDTLCSTDLLQSDLTQIGGVAQSAIDLKDLADTGYDPSTHKVQGVVLTDTTTTNTDLVTAAAIADAVWDEVITAAAHAVADSPALYLRQLHQTLVSSIDQAQAGAVGSITMAATESAVDAFFKGQLITITAGTGKGQSRACYEYNGATKVALIRPNWAINPDGTSWYAIGNLGSAVIAAIEDIDFPATQKTQITTIDTVVDAVKAKTDNLPADPADESLLEAAITTAHSTTDAKIDAVDNYIDTEVAAILAAVDTEVAAIKAVTDTLTLAAIADAVLDEVTEGTTTLRHSVKLVCSALMAKTSGGGTNTLVARDIGDTKNRITLTTDANGNRIASTLDAT